MTVAEDTDTEQAPEASVEDRIGALFGEGAEEPTEEDGEVPADPTVNV